MAPLGPSRAIILGNSDSNRWYPRLDSGETPQHLMYPKHITIVIMYGKIIWKMVTLLLQEEILIM